MLTNDATQLIKSLEVIGITEHDDIIDHLQDFTTIEVRQAQSGTGNFDTTNVAYYNFIGEITDYPEWQYDLDSPEWIAAVKTVQDKQLSLLGDQLFGIADNGEVHYVFDAYTCLVWNKAELGSNGYLIPDNAITASIDYSLIGSIDLYDKDGELMYTVYERSHPIGMICLRDRLESEWFQVTDDDDEDDQMKITMKTTMKA